MHRKNLIVQGTFFLLLMLCLVACSKPVYSPTRGWRTSTPEEQGMDSEILANMFDAIKEQGYDYDSITILRNGYMVVDATFYPCRVDTKHFIYAVSKGITGTLIGIALEQGFIDSVDQSVLGFFPDRTVANRDTNKEAITLEHLVNMTAGLDCSDSRQTVSGSALKMNQTDDWIQYMLDLPMVGVPGESLAYCDGVSFLLSAILQETTGMTTSEFAQAYLFDPLDISDVVWLENPQGIALGYSGLMMLPHDMAKMGYLYLNQGRWTGEQIISEDWVEATIQVQVSAFSAAYEFSNHWWIPGDGLYESRGHAGQIIDFLPEYDLVLVFTSSLNRQHDISPRGLLHTYIEPAIKSYRSLRPNPEAVERLEDKIQQVAESQEAAQAVSPLPALAAQISGKTIVFEANPLGLQSTSLGFTEGSQASMMWSLEPERAEYLFTWPDLSSWDVGTLEWAVGLDDVCRVTAGPYGTPWAFKGLWASDNMFVVEADTPGNGFGFQLAFTFDDDRVDVAFQIEDYVVIDLIGKLE